MLFFFQGHLWTSGLQTQALRRFLCEMPATSAAAKMRQAVATRTRKRLASMARWLRKPWIKQAFQAKAREAVKDLKAKVSELEGNLSETEGRVRACFF